MTYTMKARPTTYRGVNMRSRLEASYAQWLDTAGIAWTYEPRCFADSSGQYLPDFQLHGVYVEGAERTIYVEVKPTSDAWLSARTGERMSIIWSSEPDAWLLAEIATLKRPLIIPPPGDEDHSLFDVAWCATTRGGPSSLVYINDRRAPRWGRSD